MRGAERLQRADQRDAHHGDALRAYPRRQFDVHVLAPRHSKPNAGGGGGAKGTGVAAGSDILFKREGRRKLVVQGAVGSGQMGPYVPLNREKLFVVEHGKAVECACQQPVRRDEATAGPAGHHRSAECGEHIDRDRRVSPILRQRH
jgi:hypothetical protein